MKKLDLSSGMNKFAWNFLKSRASAALSVPQSVEKSVYPIYQRIKNNTSAEQVGSGVLVTIKNQYFIFSASHVFEEIGNKAILVGPGDGSPLLALEGDRFSSLKGPSGTHSDDRIDASVFHIHSDIPDSLKIAALTIDDMEYEGPDLEKSVHMVSGFRYKISKTIGDQTYAEREAFPTMEIDESKYGLYNRSYQENILLAYEDEVYVSDRWQKSPTPVGMSGGAIIKVDGISILPLTNVSSAAKQLLSGICIGTLPDKGELHGVLIGTRIVVHLNLLAKYLPDIFN